MCTGGARGCAHGARSPQLTYLMTQLTYPITYLVCELQRAHQHARPNLQNPNQRTAIVVREKRGRKLSRSAPYKTGA
jgi:hypothetical protein